jgi:hypothetical protein
MDFFAQSLKLDHKQIMITPSTQYSLVPYLQKNQDLLVVHPRVVGDCRINNLEALGKEPFFQRMNRYEHFIKTYCPAGIYNEKSHILMPENNVAGLLIDIYA